MKHILLARVSLASLALACIFGSTASSKTIFAQGNATDVTIEDIKRAWTERQEKIRTARFTWKEERRVRQFGNILELSQQRKGLPPLEEAVIPEITLVFGTQPGQVRFENEDAGSRVSGAPPKRSLDAFDGVEGTSYYHHSGQRYGMGFVNTKWDGQGLYSLVALQLTCRPMDQNLRSVDFDVLSLEPTEVLIDGHRCRQLRELGRSHPKLSTEIYVDLERDFVPLRYVSRVEGQPSVQNDIVYPPKPNVDGLWLPESWNATFFFSNGEISSHSKITVSLCELNQPVPEDQFRITFPPLTKIVDKTVDTGSYSKPEAFFFKMPDGTRRALKRLGDDPMSTLQPHPARSLRRWIVVVNTVIALSLIAYALMRRWLTTV